MPATQPRMELDVLRPGLSAWAACVKGIRSGEPLALAETSPDAPT